MFLFLEQICLLRFFSHKNRACASKINILAKCAIRLSFYADHFSFACSPSQKYYFASKKNNDSWESREWCTYLTYLFLQRYTVDLSCDIYKYIYINRLNAFIISSSDQSLLLSWSSANAMFIYYRYITFIYWFAMYPYRYIMDISVVWNNIEYISKTYHKFVYTIKKTYPILYTCEMIKQWVS